MALTLFIGSFLCYSIGKYKCAWFFLILAGLKYSGVI